MARMTFFDLETLEALNQIEHIRARTKGGKWIAIRDLITHAMDLEMELEEHDRENANQTNYKVDSPDDLHRGSDNLGLPKPVVKTNKGEQK